MNILKLESLYIILFLLLGCLNVNGQDLDPNKYYIPEEYREEIFFDEFLTNKNNWILVINENSFRKLENGYLNCWSYFTNDPQYWKSAFSLKKINVDEDKDFEIETSIKCTQYGVSSIPLIWGRNSKNLHTFYFGFTDKNKFQIIEFNDGEFNIIKNSKSNYIKINDYNKLTIRKFGNELCFFINEQLVDKMPYIKMPGKEFGFQAPSNTIIYVDFFKMSYIGDINYEKLVKRLVQQKYNQWAIQGKFEKTIDYKNRVNQTTKSKTIATITQDIIDSIGNSQNKFELLRNDYDPDKETFTIFFKEHDPIEVAVPIKEAPSFDKNFFRLILTPRFTLKDNTFPLIYMRIENPENKQVYGYRNDIEPFDVKNIFPSIEEVDTVLIPKEVILKEVAKQESYFQKNLTDYTNQMIQAKTITDNVKTNVSAKVVETVDDAGVPELNYQVTYSYEVIKAKFESEEDDFPLGKYKVSSSNAAKITLNEMKESIENKLYKFLGQGTKVTIKITGSADATPIKNAIKYDGEYGVFNDESCMVNNKLASINLDPNSGITTNEQLAFLRTYSVRQFIETYIDALNVTQNKFQHYCVISDKEGGEYRRISIELTIHKAFNGKKANEIFAQTGIKAGTKTDVDAVKEPAQKSDVDISIPLTTIKNKNYFALIIGNETYDNEIKVPYAIHDASVFKQYCLRTFGIPETQVHYIENASFGQLKGEIKWLTDIIKAFNGEANILLYYAGHGMPDEQTGNAYLLPVDGNASIPETAIKIEDLYAKLQETKTKSVTVFLDACFSGASRDGGMLAEARGVRIAPKQNILSNNMVVFSATSNAETALPYKDKYHGMFTYFLLKKIQESNGYCSYADLFEYIKTNVTQQSILINQKQQTPLLNTSIDFIDNWKELQIKN